LSAAAAIVSGAVVPVLPLVGGAVVLLDETIGTGTVIATAVTGTAAPGGCDPDESAAVVVSEVLPSLDAGSFLPGVLLSVSEGFGGALSFVVALASGFAGNGLLLGGGARFD
jgi:hypothetical protein